MDFELAKIAEKFVLFGELVDACVEGEGESRRLYEEGLEEMDELVFYVVDDGLFTLDEAIEEVEDSALVEGLG